MSRDRNFEKLMQKGEIRDLTVNDGFTPISRENSPASTVNPKTGTGKPPLRDPWAVR